MILHPSLDIIDSSKLSDFMHCPRYFLYRHVFGWETEGHNHNLVFGEAMHAALEVLYRHSFSQDMQNAAYATFLDVYREWYPAETDDDFGAKSPYAAAECIESYCHEYSSDQTRYEVLNIGGEPTVEVCGYAPIDHRTKLYFRMDAVLRDRSDGRIFCLEHKTASRGGRTWAAQWELSVQIGTYTHALYSLFPPSEVYGVRVNGLIFLKRGQEFERVPCERTYSQMQVWHTMVKSYADRLRASLNVLEIASEELSAEPALTPFPLNPGACTKWNRICAYHDFCTCWANPLLRCDEVPLGFKSEFWDPQDRQRKKGDQPAPIDPFAGMESDVL